MAALVAELSASPYTLERNDGDRPRHGALLRVRWTDGVTGYADVHPWPELGDATLEAELKMLAAGTPLSLGARSLQLARHDAEARRDHRSLFSGLTIPKSHGTVVRPERLRTEDLANFEALGFTLLKFKVSPQNLPAVLETVPSLPKTFRVRLDANAQFDASNIQSLLRALDALGDRIDFVEDPTANGNDWPMFSVPGGVSWASDRIASPDPDVVVLKANVSEPLECMQQNQLPERWVVTSALDHPVGQSFAAWEAARAQARYGDWVDTCGLATHLVYQRNTFAERLEVRDGRLVVDVGFGIGFDSLWHELPWTNLRCG